MTSSGTPQVVLADDDVLLREGIASLLDRSGFEVIGQAGNGAELLALARSARPELAIIDIRMPPGHAHRRAAGGAGDPGGTAATRPSSCFRRMSRSTRRWICWRAESAWATC